MERYNKGDILELPKGYSLSAVKKWSAKTPGGESSWFEGYSEVSPTEYFEEIKDDDKDD